MNIIDWYDGLSLHVHAAMYGVLTGVSIMTFLLSGYVWETVFIFFMVVPMHAYMIASIVEFEKKIIGD